MQPKKSDPEVIHKFAQGQGKAQFILWVKFRALQLHLSETGLLEEAQQEIAIINVSLSQLGIQAKSVSKD